MPMLYVALGSALGGVGRYLLTGLVDTRWQQAAAGISLGTLGVNLLGSFLIALLLPWCREEALHCFVAVGLLGGFTTFSSFSLQTVQLLADGKPGPALCYIALSLACCLLAAAAGWWLGARLAS